MFLFGIKVHILGWHAPIGCWGCYNAVSELQFSTLSLDGLSKLNVEEKFHRELILKWPNFNL
jgi:hypothetical protein